MGGRIGWGKKGVGMWNLGLAGTGEGEGEGWIELKGEN